MKKTEENIYREAFKLFLTKNYELVTFRDIENAIGMSRGAIFYYAKDKEDLYRKSVDKYVLQNQKLFYRVNINTLNSELTLYDFIELYLNEIENTLNRIYNFIGSDLKHETIDRASLSLVLNMENYYPNFSEKIIRLFEQQIEEWSEIIDRAKINSEVKGELNTCFIAKQFLAMYRGILLSQSITKGINLKELKELWMDYYNLIKK